MKILIFECELTFKSLEVLLNKFNTFMYPSQILLSKYIYIIYCIMAAPRILDKRFLWINHVLTLSTVEFYPSPQKGKKVLYLRTFTEHVFLHHFILASKLVKLFFKYQFSLCNSENVDTKKEKRKMLSKG